MHITVLGVILSHSCLRVINSVTLYHDGL